MLCISYRSALGASLAIALLLTSAAADARVCLVRDFNTEFCRKGDDLLYMPAQWGNEQLPIEFIAKKCDSTHQISYTKGAVACVYAGPKEVFDATEAAARVPSGSPRRFFRRKQRLQPEFCWRCRCLLRYKSRLCRLRLGRSRKRQQRSMPKRCV